MARRETGAVTGPCGVCGVVCRLSQTHIPPKSSGNRAEVARIKFYLVGRDQNQLREGTPQEGGLWMHGLCGDCNSLAGGLYDPAYTDFARRFMPIRRLQRGGYSIPPSVKFAPGLVARSVLFMMMGLNPHLRTSLPSLTALKNRNSQIEFPASMQLLFAVTEGNRARISSGTWYLRVLGRRETLNTYAEIYFPPFAWTLVPRDAGTWFNAQGWGNATDWLRFGPDRTAVDLRDVIRSLPLVQHPLHNPRTSQDWVHTGHGPMAMEAVIPDWTTLV